MTPGCVKASAEIISNMDHTADPCDDFYQFACGGFIEKTVIPDDRTRMSSFSVLSDELLTQVRYQMWKFQDFSVNQILRETNFEGSTYYLVVVNLPIVPFLEL